MSFDHLGLCEAIVRAVRDAGYDTATDVQSRAIPPALSGADLMVSARTGSGKTASFLLPALERLLRARERRDAAPDEAGPRRRETEASARRRDAPGVRVLVLTPTRELALQVGKAALVYGRHVPGLRVATVVGGVPYAAQIAALRRPLDLLIATPGRLLDHLRAGRCALGGVEMLVLDEADRMLDLGFVDDIRDIAAQTPAQRQTVMYSATFAGHVGALAHSLLREPQRIDVASHTDTHEHIEQRLHWADNLPHKNALLDHILTQREIEQALVFTRTQVDADRLADRLAEMGHAVASLHGGMPQGRRNRVLQGLRTRRLRVLVATDVAARGIDVPGISHVINYGLPLKAEDYVHRIGRTGRAGRQGLAITLGERMDVSMIRRIQQFTTQDIPVATVAGLEPARPAPKLHGARPVTVGAGARPARDARHAQWQPAPRGPQARRSEPSEQRHTRSANNRAPWNGPQPPHGHAGATDVLARGHHPAGHGPRGTHAANNAFDRPARPAHGHHPVQVPGVGPAHRPPHGLNAAPSHRAGRTDAMRGKVPAGEGQRVTGRPRRVVPRPR